MDVLIERGLRHFKFIDRTFNLNINISETILNFFLDKNRDDLFLHFEMIPDRLPERLKLLIEKFSAGSLQFEIGIQTFNQDVQKLISRRQKNELSKSNLRWLKEKSNAYTHADLIFGLPGDTLESFATSL